MTAKIALSLFSINIIQNFYSNNPSNYDKPNRCIRSETTASGSYAPKIRFCSGDLIFEEEFNDLDLDLWHHEITLNGDQNGEFEWYVNNRSNSYTLDGQLHIKPTFTAYVYDEQFLTSGHLNLDPCTDAENDGCIRHGNHDTIIQPIQSAWINTKNSFQFKYGIVEVVARNPRGDWLWPAIWLSPATNYYGNWPVSGKIDIMESRGNAKLIQDDVNIGTERFSSTIHWGPKVGHDSLDAWQKAHFTVQSPNGYNTDFHTYRMEWNTTAITFSIDGQVFGVINPGLGGFWDLGGFREHKNPWKKGNRMAPFDKEFYININLAVGGTNGYFPDIGCKPWKNDAGKIAAREFWNYRYEWKTSWEVGPNNINGPIFVVKSVKVWAI